MIQINTVYSDQKLDLWSIIQRVNIRNNFSNPTLKHINYYHYLYNWLQITKTKYKILLYLVLKIIIFLKPEKPKFSYSPININLNGKYKILKYIIIRSFFSPVFIIWFTSISNNNVATSKCVVRFLIINQIIKIFF